MNALVVLGLLLMVVPMQLFINHLVRNTETGTNLHQIALNRCVKRGNLDSV